MNVTTGIDIVEVNRIKALITKRGNAFLRRVFAPEEIAYCSRKTNSYPHYAARFAAKEAFFKAFQRKAVLAYKDIIVYKKGMVPHIRLAERKRSATAAINSVSLSIAHEREYAVAVVVLVREK